MKTFDIEQRSDEWKRRRLGKPTASQFDRIIQPKYLKQSVSYKQYLCELVYERYWKKPWERFPNGRVPQAVQDGIDREPHAAAQFQALHPVELETIGFVTDDRERYGCSPDRLIRNKNEIVEIKCPTEPTHIRYMVYGVEDAYYAQIQGQLLIGGWERCHFYSYHPEMAEVRIPVERDEKFIAALAGLLEQFCNELDLAERIVREKGCWPQGLPSAEDEGEV